MADHDLDALGASYSLDRNRASGGHYDQSGPGPSTRTVLLIWSPLLVLGIPFACWAIFTLYQNLTAPLPDANDFGREPIDSAYAWGGRIAQFVVLAALSLIPVVVAAQRLAKFRRRLRERATSTSARPASR